MTLSTPRVAAWLAVTLIALASAAAEVLPTLGAGVASAVNVCAPEASSNIAPKARLRDIAVQRAPRCGVA
ncbi:MAG TPA: hypothetical protein VGI14_20260 [Casimicrobiaceae bacterium]|jgi:hypothetical protein